MDLRSYTKQELALLYFPDSDPDVARAHLMRWIVRCTQLYEQLLKSGYTKSSKEFNPLQVSYIFFHLGEPWYLSVKIGEYRWATMSIGELGKWNVVSLHCDSEREVSHGSHRSHGFSSLHATVLTMIHSKDSVRSQNEREVSHRSHRFAQILFVTRNGSHHNSQANTPWGVKNLWKSVRSVGKQQALRSAHSTFNINH